MKEKEGQGDIGRYPDACHAKRGTRSRGVWEHRDEEKDYDEDDQDDHSLDRCAHSVMSLTVPLISSWSVEEMLISALLFSIVEL